MSNYPQLNKPLANQPAQQGGAYPPPGGQAAPGAPVAGAKDYGAQMPQATERFAENTGFRDPVFAVLFVLAFLSGLGYTGYAFGSGKVKMGDMSDQTKKTVGAVGGSFVGAALILPYAFLTLLRLYAKQIIWMAAIFAICLNFACGALLFTFGKSIAGCDNVNCGDGNPYTGLAIMFLVLGLISMLWLYVVKSRIPFASEMLSLSTSIIKQFPATVGYMYLGVVMQVGWFFCIIVSFVGLINSDNSKLCSNVGGQNDGGQNCEASGSVSPAIYSLVSFLGLFVSITLTNIMHVTTNGSVASWFFFAGSGTEVANPTTAAFKRAASKSLGSVALGSLIITIIRMLRSSLRSMRRNRNPFLVCCAYILLSILERVIEYITQYAFVYVAVYGKPFIASAKCTMQLLTSRGVDAIINDDLTSSALTFMSFIFGLLGGGGAYIFAHDSHDVAIICIFVGIGVMAICMLAADVVGCAIHTIFVCYAEDPAVLAETKPAVSERLSSAFSSHYPAVQLAPPARV